MDRAGWRTCLGALLFLGLLLIPASPMRPLLLLATQAAGTTVAAATGWLAGTGAALIALTSFLAGRLP